MQSDSMHKELKQLRRIREVRASKQRRQVAKIQGILVGQENEIKQLSEQKKVEQIEHSNQRDQTIKSFNEKVVKVDAFMTLQKRESLYRSRQKSLDHQAKQIESESIETERQLDSAREVSRTLEKRLLKIEELVDKLFRT
jgi:CRISPR/Cas system-associated protein Cas5 (RAMP superfamily)